MVRKSENTLIKNKTKYTETWPQYIKLLGNLIKGKGKMGIILSISVSPVGVGK